MRLTEYTQLIMDGFGAEMAAWISHSHVLAEFGDTADALIERGVDPGKVWDGLCDDFSVPEERRLGVGYPAK